MNLRRVLASLIVCAACSPQSNVPTSGAGAGNEGGASVESGGGGQGQGAAGAGSSSDGGSASSFGSGSGGSEPLECASESLEATLLPLTMFIAFDRSGSMDDNNKWDNATAALRAFFGDPGAAGLEVALRFFPKSGCDENNCNDDGACAVPEVAAGALTTDSAPADIQEQLLINAINATSPNGPTPMSAALEGGIDFSLDYLQTYPNNKMVVILVTDGEPNGCIESIGGISNIAALGLANGIVTYTVGLQGSNEGQLQTIAEAGGGSAFVIGNGDTQAELVAALQAIRGEQIACEIPVPVPSNGEEFRPDLVNVEFTPSGGGEPIPFGVTDGAPTCGANQAWYYDDPQNPSTILLCPAACDLVQGDDDGQLNVVLGCISVPA